MRTTATSTAIARVTAPAGMDGVDGQHGMVSMETVIQGISGAHGDAEIFIQDGPVIHGPYSSPFSLVVVSFEIKDSNYDEVFEFGETLTVGKIEIRNNGIS